MLAHPTQERLLALGLTGMATALEDQRRQPDIAALAFEERLALLLDRETMERENKRLVARLRFATLRQERSWKMSIYGHVSIVRCSRNWQQAIGSTASRTCWSSVRPESASLGSPARSATRRAATTAPSPITGSPGCSRARGDGRYGRLLKALGRVQLLILDDWGLAPLTSEQRRDLLEIMDDRHERGSTIVTSQVPVDHWHEVIGDPTIADAVLDRLVHNAHRLLLKGDSLRKRAAKALLLDADAVA
jgi:hypothetical protein